jgi:hypothetical protein
VANTHGVFGIGNGVIEKVLLSPISFIATTVNLYSVEFFNSEIVNVLVAGPVIFGSLLCGRDITLYPVIGVFPLNSGGSQLMIAVPGPGVTVIFVGEVGTVLISSTHVNDGVGEDGKEFPIELIATTLYV